LGKGGEVPEVLGCKGWMTVLAPKKGGGGAVCRKHPQDENQ